MTEIVSPSDDWISVYTAAEILGVSHNTVRAQIERGEITPIGKLEGRIVILSRRAIEALAEARHSLAAQLPQPSLSP